jgi:hypothetical protein
MAICEHCGHNDEQDDWDEEDYEGLHDEVTPVMGRVEVEDKDWSRVVNQTIKSYIEQYEFPSEKFTKTQFNKSLLLYR